jgi:hypothetical protein
VSSLDVGGVGSPTGSFEGRRIEEAIVYGEKTLANAVCDFVEVACAKLIRDQPGDVSVVKGPERDAD